MTMLFHQLRAAAGHKKCSCKVDRNLLTPHFIGHLRAVRLEAHTSIIVNNMDRSEAVDCLL